MPRLARLDAPGVVHHVMVPNHAHFLFRTGNIVFPYAEAVS
jgi:hypothetical protein